jgi:xanthine dehydrogenase accessory factor
MHPTGQEAFMSVTDLVESAAALTRARVPFVRATVVRAQHPTSSHAGDTALVRADGTIEGFVGGSCAESSVRRYGLQVLQGGEPLLLRIVPGDDPGSVEPGAVTVANPCLSGGSMEIFLEPRLPAPRVLVVGDTPIARSLAALGAPLGFAVELTDGTAQPRPDDAALVVASHGRGEEPALTAALRAGVPYVGLVASRVRGAAVLGSLDVPDELRARVHSPAGLDLGGRTAAEIALSVLAELVAERRSGVVVPAAATEPAPQSQPARPATAVDPVCGMTVAAVPATLHLETPGGTVWFCCAGCRDAYTADPVRHAS